MTLKFLLKLTLPGILLLLAGCGGDQKPNAAEPTAGGKSSVGGTCKADADCAQGLSCDTGDPGGNCQKKCAASADCGSGNVCSSNKCYRACKAKPDCREGYTCMGKAPEMFCDVAGEDEQKEGEHGEQK